MDHIFWESDTIDFGAPSRARRSEPTRPAPTKKPTPPATPTPERSDSTPQLQPIRRADSLRSLIDVMKPTFLPKEEHEGTLRIVAFSAPSVDPLFLLHRDEATILIGTGFSTQETAGRVYVTFPDQRLAFSERAHIRAWILVDASIDVTPFLAILPTLDFPPIYATRAVIAKFRNTIKDPSFLEKCRFFEIFSDEAQTRNIAGMEFATTRFDDHTVLALRVGKKHIGLPHIIDEKSALYDEVIQIRAEKDGWIFGTESVEVGEIIMPTEKMIKKHALKFSFDTFYFDEQSVGVVAGYTLADRAVLSQAGVLIFTLQEDARARTISGHIFIDSRGFVHSHETMRIHKEILKAIRISYENTISQNPHIDRGDLAQVLKKEIAKYCFVLTGRAPMVMPIIM